MCAALAAAVAVSAFPLEGKDLLSFADTGFGLEARDDALVLKTTCRPTETLDFFLCPSGRDFDFYRFTVASDGTKKADFASEGGNIHPDPYAPVWHVSRTDSADRVVVEVTIPWSSFYMTRNDNWSTRWLIALERGLKPDAVRPAAWRKLAGFPKRRSADDVALTDVAAIAEGAEGGKPTGQLRVSAYADEGGAYMFVSSLTGTRDVTLRKGHNRLALPCAFSWKGRRSVRLGLVRKGTNEKYAREYPVLVDYDDVLVRLSCPEYRDSFYPGQDASRVKGVVKSVMPGAVTVSLEGPGFPRRETVLPSGGGAIDFDTSGFQDGEAKLVMTVGDVRCEKTIRKLAPTGHQMSWISKGRLVIDGKPVLRRNFYAMHYRGGAAFDEKVSADAKIGMTTNVIRGLNLEPFRVIPDLERREAKRDVVPCREYFDKIDAWIDAHRETDFTYYYISDEPECRGLSPVYLRHVYEHVRERDPYHVVLTASRGGRRYFDCADWFETHPYLDPHDDGRGNRRYGVKMNEIGSYLDAFEAWDRPDKCIGFIPTLFAYRTRSISHDYPTFREYVCLVWAAMMRGGKTLFPYAYHDFGDRPALYEGNRYVFSSFGALSEFVLDGTRTTLLRTPEAECVRWDLAGRTLFALANLTDGRRTVSVKGLSGAFREFRGTRTFSPTGETSFDLGPFEVVVATTASYDAGLPTLAETEKLINELEYARTHRNNQLLEKYEDVEFASSIAQSSFYKLIDGTRDVLAWNQSRTKDPYVEFAFPRAPVAFSRIRVYGRGLDGMEVRVRKGGEWRKLTPTRTDDAANMKELSFAEAVSTVKVRVAFPSAKAKDIELYEVEIPKAGGAPVVSPHMEPGRTPVTTDALWSFDGSNADWSGVRSDGTKWFGETNRTVFVREDGRPGFVFRGHATHDVPFDPEYPWLEVVVDSFAEIEGVRYKAWSVRGTPKKIGHLCGTVTHPAPGLYTIPLPAFTARHEDRLRVYDSGFEMTVRYLRNVKKPANLLKAERNGDVLSVSLELAEPCEDVSAMIVRDARRGRGFEAFPINGTSTLELKASDDGRIWRASVPIGTSGQAKPRQVYVKCRVLGGALDVPIFTTIDAEF